MPEFVAVGVGIGIGISIAIRAKRPTAIATAIPIPIQTFGVFPSIFKAGTFFHPVFPDDWIKVLPKKGPVTSFVYAHKTKQP